MTEEEIHARPNYGLPMSESIVPRMPTNRELGLPEFTVRKKPKKKKVKYIKTEAFRLFNLEYKTWHYSTKSIPPEIQTDFKFDDNGTNALTKSVVAYLTMHGCRAARINTQGNYNQHLGMFIKSGSTKGMPDVVATIRGLSVDIEVKYKKDTQSKVQKEIETAQKNAGGVYMMVRTFDDFLEKIEKYL